MPYPSHMLLHFRKKRNLNVLLPVKKTRGQKLLKLRLTDLQHKKLPGIVDSSGGNGDVIHFPDLTQDT